MKTTIEVEQLRGGNLLLGHYGNHYFVQWTCGEIHEYTKDEMKECFNYEG